ncbi:SPOSA6832_00575, partial [Sporobolomyces salmonicolor]
MLNFPSDSIERDFTDAKNWLLSNDKNLRGIWTALQVSTWPQKQRVPSGRIKRTLPRPQASDKLKDLDQRLTKAFATKIFIAMFSALQDTRSGVINIQTTLEGLPTNLETVCRTSTKEAIHQAIDELKKEAYEAVGGGEGPKEGFRNGEAEKIISQVRSVPFAARLRSRPDALSQLVDQLAEQERIKEDEELLSAVDYLPLLPSRPSFSPPVPYAAGPSSIPAVPCTPAASRNLSQVPVSSSEDDPFEPTPCALDPFEFPPPIRPNRTLPTSGDESSLFSRKFGARSPATSEISDEPSRRTMGKGKERKDRIPAGAIVFNPRDPFSEADLIDPVLANDGLIHDRWTLVEGSHKNMRDPAEPLLIVGGLVQLREAIFRSFPERRAQMQAQRQAYREATIRLYDSSDYTNYPAVIKRLSHVLLFELTPISIRIRRGIARYRLRELAAALEDLDNAVELSTRDVDGTPNRHELNQKKSDDPPRYTSGASRLQVGPDGLLTAAFSCLLLRASARQSLGEYELALSDFETGLRLRPASVKDVGALRCALAEVRAECGDREGAQRDFDMAVAIGNPGQHFAFISTREEYGM